MSTLLAKDRAWLRAHDDYEFSPSKHELFQSFVERRASGEPVQYITKVQEFFGIALHVAPGVLIPRPETEHLVEAVVEWANQSAYPVLNIVDVGTGSGAIAIALASKLLDSQILALDTSDGALAIARLNAAQHGFASRISCEQRDLLQGIPNGSVDIVVSNPPYVPTKDAAGMQREVIMHEPHSALFAGEDGLDVYRRLIPQAYAALRPGGLLAMELGWGQRDQLAQFLEGWSNLRFLDDYAGIPRVVMAECSAD